MKLLTFTHANLHTKVEIVATLVYSFYYSETHKAVFLVASGGAIIPVKEDLETVKKLLTGP